MLSTKFTYCDAKCHYAKCRYGECHYTECRGAFLDKPTLVCHKFVCKVTCPCILKNVLETNTLAYFAPPFINEEKKVL